MGLSVYIINKATTPKAKEIVLPEYMKAIKKCWGIIPELIGDRKVLKASC